MAGGRKEYELLFSLKAALGGNFNLTFQNAINTTKQLQNTLSDVKKVQSDISGFKKTQDAIKANKATVQELEATHVGLQTKLSQTVAKEKELQKTLENSAKATGTETEEYKRLESELKKTQNEKERLTNQVKNNEAATVKATQKIADEEKKLSDLTMKLESAGVNTSKLTQENDKLSAAYDRVKQSQENIARLNQQIDANKTAIAGTKAELTKTIGTVAAVGAAFTVPIKGAMEFESSMAEVAKVVDWIGTGNGATAQQIQQYNELSDGLYGLTRQIPMTAKEFAAITAAAGQANVAADNAGLLKFASDAAKMGIAFDISADQAGDFMAKWRTSFKMTQAQVVDLSNIINHLGNTTPATAAQISNVVTKIGPLGEVAGLSSKELAALGATIVSVGINEDVAATGIKNLMLDMTKGTATTKKMEGVLARLGTSSTDLANRMQTDAKGAILDFMRAVQQLPEAEQAATLNTYFGEQSVAAIAPLLSNIGLLEEQFYKVGDANAYANSMYKEYEGRAGTSESSLDILKNGLKELSDTFGNIFVPGAKDGVDALAQVVWKITDFIKANPDLIKTLTKVAAGMAGLKVAGLGAKLGFQEIELGVNISKKAFEIINGKAANFIAQVSINNDKLSQLGRSLSGYFGGVKNALGGVDASMSKFNFTKKLMEKFDAGGLGQVISGGMGGAINNILSPFKSIGGKIDGLLSPMGGKVTGFFGGIGSVIANGPLGKIGGVFKSLGGAGDALIKPLGGLSGIFGGLFGKVMPIIGILSLLATLFVKLNGGDISGFIKPLQEAFEAAKEPLGVIMGQLQGLGKTLMEHLMPAVEAIAPLFFQIAAAILPVLVSVFQALMPVVTVIAETVLPVLLGALQSLMPTLTSLITSILPIIKTLIDALVPVITILANVFGSVLAAGINAVMPIIANIITVFQGLIDFITGVFTGNWTKAWEGIKGIFGGAFGALVELAKAPLRAVVAVINGVIGGLRKLTVPDWVPGIGGKGINIPLIPTFSKGTNNTPDTFIAGDINGKGGELITGAAGRKVFTAAQTGDIFKNLQGIVSARQSASLNAPPSVSLAGSRSYSEAPITVNYQPTIHVDGNTPNDLDDKLRKNNESLIGIIKEEFRRSAENDKRMAYT